MDRASPDDIRVDTLALVQFRNLFDMHLILSIFSPCILYVCIAMIVATTI